MLNKKDVDSFYQNIMITHKLFKMTFEKNKLLEKQHCKNDPRLKIESQKKEKVNELINQISEPSEKFIISNIKDSGVKIIAINLFADMKKYDFTYPSSVPKNRETVLQDQATRYDLLSKIKLDKHTIYCTLAAIEVCERNDIPQSISDLVIILAILHDFGKHPEVFEKYKNKNDDLHNVVSSYYVKKTFRKYIGKIIHEDTYKQLIHTLYNHHKLPYKLQNNNKNDKNERDTLLIYLLNKADYLAREKEQIFLEGQET